MSTLELPAESKATAAQSCAPPLLAGIFGSHMVLQCEQPIKVWGRSVPDDEVQVALAGARVAATADSTGRFEAVLPSMAPGGPYELVVTGVGGRTVIDDVLLGEVWLCCGQSNMVWPVQSSTAATELIAKADRPDIRLLKIPGMENVPDDAAPAWNRCSPDSVGDFSAVAYLSGRRLHDHLKRPIGLVLAAWSGSHIEAWMSREALLQEPTARQDLLDYEACLSGDDSAFTPPVTLPRTEWAASRYNDEDWPIMMLPGLWQDAGHFFHGVTWFRRRMELPLDWAGCDLRLGLGECADEAQVFFNGSPVGSIARTSPGIGSPQSTQHTIPGRLVEPGPNTVAVRVSGYRGGCGLTGRPGDMLLGLADHPDFRSRSLVGAWRYQIEARSPMRRVAVTTWLADQKRAAHALFDSLIAPLIPFAIRGVLWYQGEQNAWQAARYEQLFRRMIRDWRARWRQGDFPFVFAQLPNMQARIPTPCESDKAELREAQSHVQSEPATAMAVTIDCGEVDLHPKDKRIVAQRLADAALAAAYQRPVHYRGPRYHSHTRQGSVMIVNFTLEAGPLEARDGPMVTGFAIAGEDRRFEWATAVVEGSSVTVWSPRVREPVAIRYAWANNPNCNLYDATGLPAEPFRTDQWPRLTEGPPTVDRRTPSCPTAAHQGRAACGSTL